MKIKEKKQWLFIAILGAVGVTLNIAAAAISKSTIACIAHLFIAFVSAISTAYAVKVPLENLTQSTAKKQQCPEGWFVFEAGQNLVTTLWFVNLVSTEDLANSTTNPRRIYVEDCETLEQALEYAHNEARMSKPTTYTIEAAQQ